MLLVDVGNSRCKWVRVQNGCWSQAQACDNAELERLQADIQRDAPRRVLVSNVAGDAVAAQIRAYCAGVDCEPVFIRAEAARCGVRNGYRIPQQLGSDRWAALIAARRRVPGACLVVNCGTATTIDGLSAQGEFLGGLILPGLSLMLHSLQANTAQLVAAEGAVQDFPQDTAGAMWSGALRATQGAIRHQFDALQRYEGTVRCLIGGGAAERVMQGLPVPSEHFEHMVLHGLQILGEDQA